MTLTMIFLRIGMTDVIDTACDDDEGLRAVTEPLTEKVTEPLTEKVTELSIERLTEQLTERVVLFFYSD